MADFFDNGESWLVVRTLINSLADIGKIAEMDDNLTESFVTSIPVATTPANVIWRTGEQVVLIDTATGTAHTLTLAADIGPSADTISIVAYEFGSNIQAGSKIYISPARMSNLILTALYPS